MSPEPLLSWARHPQLAQRLSSTPQWRQELPAAIRAASAAQGSTLAHGNGRSYGDVCLSASASLIDMRRLDRFIEADWKRGVITAEAGITLQNILALCIPRGWFLSVTPGTQFVTLGGAIANDVHGKNHHARGCFGNHVLAFGLVRSDQAGELRCTHELEPDLFAATIGGLGLTGIISWAQIQLVPIGSSWIDTVTVRFNNLSEFYRLSAELDPENEFSVSWVDCTAGGQSRGRGIYSAGRFSSQKGLDVMPPSKLAAPATPPFSLVNAVSVRAFNKVYWTKAPDRLNSATQDYQRFFYPLDGIANWNRAYGPKGFQQFQCVIPQAVASDALSELLDFVRRSGKGSFLAVLKRCGDIASPGLLSFPLPGMTLALDFAQTDQPEKTLFPTMDAIVREAGGRLYPAKDAHMHGDDFRQAYPTWQRLESLRDPALMSVFWQRVTQ